MESILKISTQIENRNYNAEYQRLFVIIIIIIIIMNRLVLTVFSSLYGLSIEATHIYLMVKSP